MAAANRFSVVFTLLFHSFKIGRKAHWVEPGAAMTACARSVVSGAARGGKIVSWLKTLYDCADYTGWVRQT
jgi:hypothetical protein